MNYSAEICNAVMFRKITHIPAICDATGMSERTFETLLGKLCGDGTLRRDRDYVYVKNESKAKLLAEAAAQSAVAVNSAAEDRVAARMAEHADTAPVKPKRTTIQIPTQVSIEKGVPIPPPFIGRMRRVIPWPFQKMEVGDSFAVPVPEGVAAKEVASLLRKDAVLFQRIMPALRVVIRTEPGDKAVRCWRESPVKAVPTAPAASKTKKAVSA